MKPAPFAYSAPGTVDEALAVLAEAGGGGKVLAGGQSLLPLLSMRLAAPERLVDINRLAELATVSVEGAQVRVGALARHAEVERDEAAYAAQPLLRQALRLVAHPTIRNRGTTVGSIAHADPCGEMTAVLMLLGGTLEAASTAGVREIAAADFFRGPLETSLAEDELARAVRFPVRDPNSGTSFVEAARRHGDYAMVGVAAQVVLDDDLQVATARAAYIAVGATPLLLDLTAPVGGASYDAADWAAAGRSAAAQTEPEADIHASADYRRHLVEVLTTRGVAQAARHAAGVEAAA